MYANTGYNASWAYSNEYDNTVDHYSSQSVASDSDDSEQELRDLEELLYSHVHYEPNYQCKTGVSDDLTCLELHTAQLSDGVSDGLVNTPASASEQEICATRRSGESEVIIIDAQEPPDEVARNTVVTSNLLSEQLKCKVTSHKTSESADEIRTKFKKVGATGCPNSVALESTDAKHRCSLNAPGNGAGMEILCGGEQEVHHADEQHLAKKKKLKVKHRSGISDAAAAVETAKFIVLDSVSDSSSSSSDPYCCDLSSEEVYSDAADDIKLSNIKVDIRQTSDVDALVDVLNSLPGMLVVKIRVK